MKNYFIYLINYAFLYSQKKITHFFHIHVHLIFMCWIHMHIFVNERYNATKYIIELFSLYKIGVKSHFKKKMRKICKLQVKSLDAKILCEFGKIYNIYFSKYFRVVYFSFLYMKYELLLF